MSIGRASMNTDGNSGVLPNPFFNSAALSSPSAEPAAAVPSPEAAAVLIPESAAFLPALVDAPNAADTVDSPPVSAAFSVDDTQYIPELFSAYAARRCKDIISPPLPKAERDIDALALNAVGAALNLHPRDLDFDPPPLFLRKPRPAFLRALFQLGGTP